MGVRASLQQIVELPQHGNGIRGARESAEPMADGRDRVRVIATESTRKQLFRFTEESCGAFDIAGGSLRSAQMDQHGDRVAMGIPHEFDNLGMKLPVDSRRFCEAARSEQGLRLLACLPG